MNFFFSVLFFFPQFLWASWKVTQSLSQDKLTIERVEWVHKSVQAPLLLQKMPALLSEDAPPSAVVFERLLLPDGSLAPTHIQKLSQQKMLTPWEGSQMQVIIMQGPVGNRINLTFVGDGYQAQEKEKFFADVRRLSEDLFAQKTFKSYLPLFNVFAVFVPSPDSGISDVVQKNTALGLYRSPRGSKRAIMPGKPQEIRRALQLSPATDYPILVANDDYYGGLGGEFAITTRAAVSGPKVLRHELGHNFGQVGEEYDEGYAYFGANFSASLAVSWPQWVERPRAFEAEYLFGDYLWAWLNTPYRKTFLLPGQGTQQVIFSLSSVGWESAEDVRVLLDGQNLDLLGEFTYDRSFFVTAPLRLAPGEHVLEIVSSDGDANNMLASITALAYPEDYDFTLGKMAAFSVFNVDNKKIGYRPTHNLCLMRDINSKVFCPVDQENMWLNFLRQISLIDQIDLSDGQVSLKAPALDLSIEWFYQNNGSWIRLPQLANKRSWAQAGYPRGAYRVHVQFSTPEVRLSSEHFSAQKDFIL